MLAEGNKSIIDMNASRGLAGAKLKDLLGYLPPATVGVWKVT